MSQFTDTFYKAFGQVFGLPDKEFRSVDPLNFNQKGPGAIQHPEPEAGLYLLESLLSIDLCSLLKILRGSRVFSECLYILA